DRALHCTVDQTECGGRRGSRERLTGLQCRRSSSAEGVRELRGRSGKVRRVENVEELRAKLEVRPFGNGELLCHNQILLEETRPMQQIALKVAVRARFRNRKGRRVEDLAILVEEGINTRDQVRTAHVARIAAAWRVDNRHATCRRATPEDACGRV